MGITQNKQFEEVEEEEEEEEEEGGGRGGRGGGKDETFIKRIMNTKPLIASKKHTMQWRNTNVNII
jgi:hypothetical protein